GRLQRPAAGRRPLPARPGAGRLLAGRHPGAGLPRHQPLDAVADGGGRRGDHAVAAAGRPDREPPRPAGHSPAGRRARLPDAGAGLAADLADGPRAQADRAGDQRCRRWAAERAARGPVATPLGAAALVAATRRSFTNCASAASRSSGDPRKIEAGCTVATISGPYGLGNGLPRLWVTRNALPSSDCAAVAPRQTITRGATASISASNQGWQARTSVVLGFWWMRRLPRPSCPFCATHLKCLTALET